ncbi:oxidoreductase [Raoultella sp. BAC10a-01-01]|uniref:Oxidoreductase n=1 Tax=Raoultella scottii TaxID=3040937 RepID=A0ABU8YZU2_9ENTR
MKVWFVTGASRGFGALIAEKALSVGDAVIATGRNLQDVQARLGTHPRLLVTRLNVTDELSIQQTIDAGISRFGRIDILVNNAGYGVLGAVEETSRKEVEDLFSTNVFGLLAVIRGVLPHMRRQRSGHIMNFSSIGGYEAYLGWGVYGASKFAVEGISEALCQEVALLNINVTIIEPGFFRTDFLDQQSLVSTEVKISDYDSTVGEMRNFAVGANHQQPGDPNKLASAIILLSQTPNPPLRLPLGSDTIERLRKKNKFVESELLLWEDVARSTDFS